MLLTPENMSNEETPSDEIGVEVRFGSRVSVLALYYRQNQQIDAVIQCGLAFQILFPDSDFKISHIPLTGRQSLVRETAYIAMEPCDEFDLPRHVRNSWCTVKDLHGKHYTGEKYSAYRRDYLFRFEVQENWADQCRRAR